ncbi:FAD-dependent monooxygenase [Luteimonas sp. SJ-92]|uniref:FAD-dependent monooxygenase n=1 Tax=Luteimonas salinisoli TaxID=2752307 RepID=A0A853JJJ9_9GAMM|nr:FAD-dependent oxidoreductase [Luteimonas salinisoli]NZA28638.1 FAD-dependent monooxygenase [Luteimonas salinisoli]
MQRSAAATDTDVLILGGGLAGLTLAIQLLRRDPGLQVTVLERRAHPVREAAHKVGESTVEIGAHYFADVLGLRAHLDDEQIRKFGFRFFFSEGREDIDACTELGVSRLLPTPSWQIDRGRFENFLGERARALGADFRDGAVVRSIEMAETGNDAPHRVGFERGGTAATLVARWVVDASGRAGLLKRKLGLAEANDHDANAVWWRVEGHVDPNAWSTDPAWLRRCTPPDRWRSTNHMCGPGYWFWLIPLASGSHSLGIVCDAKMHPLETMNTHERAMAWLREHQPAVASALQAHALQDFLFLRGFSYGCREVFSADRWALTGEAGLFLDPFYSPGSDFIAIANTYVCDLVEKDRAGKAFAPYAGIYQQLYFSFYENTMTLYQDQYPLFGDERVMPIKVIWDYTFYWALLAPLFFGGRLTDLAMLGRLRGELAAGSALNRAMQPLLHDWGARNAGAAPPAARLLDQFRIDWFHEMNRALGDRLEDDAFAARIAGNVARMRWLAAEILARARGDHPGLDGHGLDALLDDGPGIPASLAALWYADAA